MLIGKTKRRQKEVRFNTESWLSYSFVPHVSILIQKNISVRCAVALGDMFHFIAKNKTSVLEISAALVEWS